MSVHLGEPTSERESKLRWIFFFRRIAVSCSRGWYGQRAASQNVECRAEEHSSEIFKSPLTSPAGVEVPEYRAKVELYLRMAIGEMHRLSSSVVMSEPELKEVNRFKTFSRSLWNKLETLSLFVGSRALHEEEHCPLEIELWAKTTTSHGDIQHRRLGHGEFDLAMEILRSQHEQNAARKNWAKAGALAGIKASRAAQRRMWI